MNLKVTVLVGNFSSHRRHLIYILVYLDSFKFHSIMCLNGFHGSKLWIMRDIKPIAKTLIFDIHIIIIIDIVVVIFYYCELWLPIIASGAHQSPLNYCIYQWTFLPVVSHHSFFLKFFLVGMLSLELQQYLEILICDLVILSLFSSLWVSYFHVTMLLNFYHLCVTMNSYLISLKKHQV